MVNETEFTFTGIQQDVGIFEIRALTEAGMRLDLEREVKFITLTPPDHNIKILGQILKFVLCKIIHKTAKESRVGVTARTHTVLSRLGTKLFVQFAHALSFNDACDSRRFKARAIAGFGLTTPSRKYLSNSIECRDAKFAELVFSRTLAHLQYCDASSGRKCPGGSGYSLLHRFKVYIHADNSTVMKLVAN